MSQAEIQYLIPKQNQEPVNDAEQIVNAIGAYQAEVEQLVIQTAEIETTANESIMLRLIRRSLAPRYDHDLLHDTETMRAGVEAHFSEIDRERLSGLFVGIGIKDPIEVEKP